MSVTISGSTGIASVDGSAGSPSIRGDDSNSGIYYGTDEVKISVGGVEKFEIGTGWLTLDASGGNGTFIKTDSTGSTNLTLRKTDAGADGVDYFQCRTTSNGLRMTIEGDGDVKNMNNSYGSTSDSKLKENIVDASSQWDDIKAIKVRNWNFKSSTGMPTHKQIGVVAQEIETISAGLVSESIDRDPDTNEDLGTKTKAVKYSILYMKAIKALQEAMAKIETLETKVAALEAA